jgi:hypothetical protein
VKAYESALGLAAALVLCAGTARASKVPLSFDPTLGAQPARTQQKLAALEAKLPASFALPATLQSVKTGTLTLSFYPEMLAQLQRTGSATGTMTWPQTPVHCAKHATFTPPVTLLAAGAPVSCGTAEASVRSRLLDASACRDVEEPERYVLSYPPAVVDDASTGSIEALIGLAGEALSRHPLPNGLLPTGWVAQLRSVLWKIRRGAIDAQIAKAHASYTQILSTLTSQSACFDATVKTALTVKVGELDAELKALTTHVDGLAATDLATAQREVACMEARARTRAALPYPSLTRSERELIAFWLGGVYWRMRGGGLLPTGSTQKARTYFLQRPFQRIAELAGGAGIGNDLGTAIYLNIFDGWGEWMDMGTTAGGQDLYEDLVQMTDRGRHQVADTPLFAASAVKVLTDRGYDTTELVTGGLDMGPCYAYGLGELSNFRYADQTVPPYGAFIEGFTAVGEFCTGASMALGMAKALLDGVPSGKPAAALCLGRTCGDDGCGGSCGTCPGGKACSPDGACLGTCTPSCDGKACGDGDGCGGQCGSCDGGVAPPPGSGAGPDASSDPANAEGCACRMTTPSSSGALAACLLAAAACVGVRSRRRARSQAADRQPSSE